MFLHRLGKNLLIGFEAHVGDETTLFRAQQISCAADIQILHGYIEAAAQVRELLDGLQPAAGILGDRNERGNNQITECLLVRTPHPAAKLMQVAQTDILCLIDDNSVGVGNV